MQAMRYNECWTIAMVQMKADKNMRAIISKLDTKHLLLNEMYLVGGNNSHMHCVYQIMCA